MKILVCGATGQIGRSLVMQGSAYGLEVVGLSHAQLDLTDAWRVRRTLEQLRPALVINAAAYTQVDAAEEHSRLAYAVNRDGAAVLAEVAERLGAPLFHLSTDYVFDGQARRPYKENDTTAPLGIYGASKLAGERAIAEQLDRHLILRTSWVYGEHGGNFVKSMLRLAARPELRIVDDQIGCPSSAERIASVLLELARRYATTGELAWGLYHYSGRSACSWYAFACEIFRQAKEVGLIHRLPNLSPIPTSEYPTPARRPAWSVLDCSRFESAFELDTIDWQADLRALLDVLGEQAPSRMAV
ncbi:dTDP-4-dehydrorhamnose reductase [Stutzerimonas balearica]|uniref:dTDP-4-dehydrorhamnose reductase n=1 Tax=Stutzerimonas balearica TaxID=74829 RepID=UPI0028A12711|nr:dTDP-4-dehydrorhamnose reductase [Stutzerimonas balearica]